MIELSKNILSHNSMYRQHMMQQQQEHGSDQQFIGRLGSLPVVSSAWTRALGLYQKTKDSNVLLRTTMGMAENTVKVVSSMTKPLVDRYQPQIFDQIDAYACQYLTRLEENYPVITKKPDELYMDGKRFVQPAVDKVTSVYQFGAGTYNMGKEKVDQVKKYGSDTVIGVKDFGIDQVKRSLETTYGKMVTSKLDDVLSVSEVYVDKYLPASDSDSEETLKKEENQDPFSRATALSTKVRRRMYKKAMVNLVNVNLRSQEALSKLYSTVDLIGYAKGHLNTAKETVGNNVGAVQGKLVWAWGEITTEKDNLETPNTLEGHTIAVARHLTRQVRNGLTTIASHIPASLQVANVQERIAEARKYSEELYQSFKEVKKLDEIPAWALVQARGKMQYIQETMGYLTDVVLSLPLNWLVPSRKVSHPTAEPDDENLKEKLAEGDDSKKKLKKN